MPPDPISLLPFSLFRSPSLCGLELQCRFVSFAGTDANDALQFSDENFAVANFSGVSRFADDIDDFIQLIVGNRHINLHFWQKVDAILGAAVELRVTFLTAKSFDFSDRQALTPMEDKARTSSSLNGLITTVTSFISPLQSVFGNGRS